jgi:hypothetical protein
MIDYKRLVLFGVLFTFTLLSGKVWGSLIPAIDVNFTLGILFSIINFGLLIWFVKIQDWSKKK